MENLLRDWLAWLQAQSGFETVAACFLLLLAAWLTNFLMKRIIVRGVLRIARSMPVGADVQMYQSGIVRRLANIVPALVLILGVRLIPELPPALAQVVANVGSAFIVLSVALVLGKVLDLALSLYNRRPDAHLKPIKGYLQIVKIAVYVIATLLVIAVLVDRSPLILLSGLGAMAAVLMLIFQDTLLSLVASVQISSNDIVRVGDWIEMPQLNADGDVIDIALHTVKVQNWDKTITTIPTKRMITESFKNWRGMQQSGGRRIKRSLLLDQQSVHFLSDDESRHLAGFRLLDSYLREKLDEINAWNATLEESGRTPLNTRRITNIGTFRAYVERYLRSHGGVRQDMTLIVRQLAPTADGLPLEIYCFTNTIAWVPYEKTQSDIFDHLFAIVPEFGLRVFQHPGGQDVREAVGGLRIEHAGQSEQ
ncbi:MAG TPA: mechanosensitive ion channel family protein [Pseudomonadales bacterium]